MSNITLAQKMQSLTVGREVDSYTGVVIHAGQDDEGNEIEYSAGNATGYVLDIENPVGTQAMAQAILDGLKLRGVTYKPYEATNAILDPSAEIGDSVSVNGNESVIYNLKTKHSALMAADVSAPYDEEVDHEFTYVPRTTREFKRESAYARSRITQTENEISLEVVRATNAENELGSRITLTADAITAEVTRATSAEGTLLSRITQTADSLVSEVSRATSAESALGTRIEQRLDGITLSASSASGSSTFSLRDGSTTIDTQTLDLTVKAVNISGKLTVGQLADGSVVVSSKTETEYYLSTSSSSATGGSWSTTVPTWASGKYIWTREKTTDTLNDSTTNATYSPSSSGAYDKNLTSALSTASSASTAASAANTNALSAVARSQIIYRSMSGGTAPTAPSAWVTDTTGAQNTWTSKRPEYSSSYPACYIVTQKETVGGTVSCTTPLVDATTTVIDGSHIITGTIDATKISVNNLQAISASLAGWELSNSLIRKQIPNTYDVYMQAPESPNDGNFAFAARTYDSSTSSWVNKFYVTYGGSVYASNANITGAITATSLTLGSGVTIPYGSVSGTPDLSIYIAQDGTIGSTPAAGVTGFKVSSAGLLTCSNAVIYGTVYATAGNIGGWTISSSMIRKQVTESVDVYMQAPSSPVSGNLAFALRTYDSTNSAWVNRFYVSYGGTVYASNANIEGKITATSGVIGGVTISNGVLSGITDTNIATNGISGGSGGSIGSGTITTHNTVSGINTSLGYANFSNGVFAGTNTASYCGASYINASARLTASSEFYYQQTPVSWKTQKVVVDSAGGTVTIRYLGN